MSIWRDSVTDGVYEMDFKKLYPNSPILELFFSTKKRCAPKLSKTHPYEKEYAFLLRHKEQYEKWVASGESFWNVGYLMLINAMLDTIQKRAEEEKKKWRAFIVGLKKRNSIQFYASRERKQRRRVANGWKRQK